MMLVEKFRALKNVKGFVHIKNVTKFSIVLGENVMFVVTK